MTASRQRIAAARSRTTLGSASVASSPASSISRSQGAASSPSRSTSKWASTRRPLQRGSRIGSRISVGRLLAYGSVGRQASGSVRSMDSGTCTTPSYPSSVIGAASEPSDEVGMCDLSGPTMGCGTGFLPSKAGRIIRRCAAPRGHDGGQRHRDGRAQPQPAPPGIADAERQGACPVLVGAVRLRQHGLQLRRRLVRRWASG